MQKIRIAVMATCCLFVCLTSHAVTLVFFNPSQPAILVSTNANSDTIGSSGYLFTCSLDKWWYPGISIGPGTPTGRPVSVTWPSRVEAQTLTAGPAGILPSQISASITIKRSDGLPFDLASFTGKILGNTAGAGAGFEIMPQLNGQDALANPLTFDATGYSGATLTYSTPMLTGYDTYIISLWMDFSLTSVTLVDASPYVQPTLHLAKPSANDAMLNWATNSIGFRLQQCSSLAAGTWSDVTNVAGIIGTDIQVTVSGTNAAHFFRLKAP